MAVKSILYNSHTLQVSYEILNPQGKLDIIILHGWGSNKEIMKNSFGKYMDSFRHIYIDLPGFGKSTCNISLDTYDYARIVELLMAQISAKKDIVLGHSFGGKVGVLLKSDVLILVGSAGIKLPKPLKIKAKIAFFKVAKVFGIEKLRSAFMAEDAKTLSKPMYETFKTVVNENFEKEFKKYKGSALVCCGHEDTATPVVTAERIFDAIENSQLLEYEGDHFFFTKHAESISQEIEATVLKTLEHN